MVFVRAVSMEWIVWKPNYRKSRGEIKVKTEGIPIALAKSLEVGRRDNGLKVGFRGDVGMLESGMKRP